MEILRYKIVHFLIHNYRVLVANYKLPFSLLCPPPARASFLCLSRTPLLPFSLLRLPFSNILAKKSKSRRGKRGKGRLTRVQEKGVKEEGDLHVYKGRA